MAESLRKRDFDEADLAGEEDGVLPDDIDVEPGPKKARKKKRRSQQSQWSNRKPQELTMDPTYGQKYAFGTLEGPTVGSDDELDIEDETDALLYLRSVRIQAGSIPTVLVAPKPEKQKQRAPTSRPIPKTQEALNYDEEEGADVEESQEPFEDEDEYDTGGRVDFGGYYQDGAYTAIPDAWLYPYGDSAADQDYGTDYSEEAIEDESSSPAPFIGPQMPDSEAAGTVDEGLAHSAESRFDVNVSPAPIGSPGAVAANGFTQVSPGVDVQAAEDYETQQQPSTARHGFYGALLLQRFLWLRGILLHGGPPTEDALSRLDPTTHPTAVPPLCGRTGRSRRTTFQAWSAHVRDQDPRTAQVQCFDRAEVLRLVRVLLGGTFLRQGRTKTAALLAPRTARWLWALLARLPDAGEMDYAQIGEIRELAKRAVLLLQGVSRREVERAAAAAAGEVGSLKGREDGSEDGTSVGDEAAEGIVEEEPVEDGADVESDGGAAAAIAGDANAASMGPVKSTTEKADVSTSVSTLQGDGIGAKLPPESADRSTSAPSAVAEQDRHTDSDVEEGEVPHDDARAPSHLQRTRLAELKEDEAQGDLLEIRRLRALAELDDVPSDVEEDRLSQPGDEGDKPVEDEITMATTDGRSTLNMILTVAGELYGQRDLLEFRDVEYRIDHYGHAHE